MNTQLINPCTYQIKTYSFKPKGIGLEARIAKFKTMIWQWIKDNDSTYQKYPKWMYKEFVEKYTEPTKSGRKFLYETCKTWHTGKRLATWESNSRQWQPKRWKEETQPAAYKPPQTSQSDYVPTLDYNKAKERLKNEPKKTGHLSNLIQQNLKR